MTGGQNLWLGVGMHGHIGGGFVGGQNECVGV